MTNVTYTLGNGIIPAPKPKQLTDIVSELSERKILVDFTLKGNDLTCYFANASNGDVTVKKFEFYKLCQEAMSRTDEENYLLASYSDLNRSSPTTYQIAGHNDKYPLIELGIYQWATGSYFVYIAELDTLAILNPATYHSTTIHWQDTVSRNVRNAKPYVKVIDYKDLYLTQFEIVDDSNITMTYVDRRDKTIELKYSNAEFSKHLTGLMGKYNTRPITNALRRDLVETKHLWMTSMFGIITVKLHDGYMHTAFISPENYAKYTAALGEENITYVNNYTPALRKSPLPKDDCYDPKSSNNLISDCYIESVSTNDNVITLNLFSGIYSKAFTITNNLVPTWLLNAIMYRNTYYSPAGVIVALRKSSKYIDATLLIVNNRVGILSLKDINNNGKTVYLKDLTTVDKYLVELKAHLPNNHKVIVLG